MERISSPICFDFPIAARNHYCITDCEILEGKLGETLNALEIRCPAMTRRLPIRLRFLQRFLRRVRSPELNLLKSALVENFL